MKLIGGPMDGHEVSDDVPGVTVSFLIMPHGAEAHCFSYRDSLSGPVRYSITPISGSILGYLGPSFQQAYYSALHGQWLKTRCACGEIVATPTVEAGDPPGPPRAHPPAL